MKNTGTLASLLVLCLCTSSALPLTQGFIENRGQVDEEVLYYMEGQQASIYFTEEAVVLDLRERPLRPTSEDAMGRILPDSERDAEGNQDESQRGCALWIRFEGANAHPIVEGRGELTARYNYFLGNDQDKWRTDVPAFNAVVYRDLWPGIDLTYRENHGMISYEVVATPSASPGQLSFRYEGAEQVILTANGSYRIETVVGSLIDTRPIPGLAGGTLSWIEGPDGFGGGTMLDNDTDLVWGTYLGGSLDDWSQGLALDPDGNVVVTGWTLSPEFPTTSGAYDTTFDVGPMAFVSKLEEDGSDLIWSTFLGGSGGDQGLAVVVDPFSFVLVTGTTSSTDFPTHNAYDETHNGGLDVFIAGLNDSGDGLLNSTYLGGSQDDTGEAIAKWPDAVQWVVTGVTRSADFPTTSGAYDQTHNGGEDFFVARFSNNSDLVWSTFLGGSDLDEKCSSVAIDDSWNVVVGGETRSADFPTTGQAYDGSLDGVIDVVVAKLNASGSDLDWSTFLGGGGNDFFRGGQALALTETGEVLLTGGTTSSDFPTTAGAYDETFNGGGEDVFVTKLNAVGSDLVWSTFLGGSGGDEGVSLALTLVEDVMVTGYTGSSDFPTTAGAYDGSFNGQADAFVSLLGTFGGYLYGSTYLGGTLRDEGKVLAVDSDRNVVVTGLTRSGDFPTTSEAYDTSINGEDDVFVSKLRYYVGSGVDNDTQSLSGAFGFTESHPNPFGESTVISYGLPEPSKVTLSIHDVAGRLVRMVVPGVLQESGRHRFRWDGRTGSGLHVRAGVYFARLEVGGTATFQKLAVLR